MKPVEAVDVLAIGPHPDDVELGIGGTLLHLADLGYRTAIVDVTRGEMGSRGTPEIRAREARLAAERLRVQARENLGLPDGGVHADDAARRAFVQVYRKWRPTIVLAPLDEDLHPDHAASGLLAREAAFLAGLVNYDPGLDPHRPRTVLQYFMHTQRAPDLVVDVSAHFSAKRAACEAYESQFHRPGVEEAPTYIARAEFWDWWEARHRHYGQMIGATHGEAFVHAGPVPLVDPVRTFRDFGYYPDPRPRKDASS